MFCKYNRIQKSKKMPRPVFSRNLSILRRPRPALVVFGIQIILNYLFLSANPPAAPAIAPGIASFGATLNKARILPLGSCP